MTNEDFIDLVRLLVEVSDICRLHHRSHPKLEVVWSAAETALEGLNEFEVPQPREDQFLKLFEIEE
jgi:hypothetical protein